MRFRLLLIENGKFFPFDDLISFHYFDIYEEAQIIGKIWGEYYIVPLA